MNPKQIEVSCPCCGVQLTIDVLTAAVLRSTKPAQLDETGKAVLDEGRWDDAHTKVKGRHTEAQDIFDAALTKERNRARDLDDLFDKARKKARREPPEGEKPPEA